MVTWNDLESGERRGEYDETIKRLRKEKVDLDRYIEETGYKQGVEWAKDSATYGQLLNLSNDLRCGMENRDVVLDGDYSDAAYSLDEVVFHWIDGCPNCAIDPDKAASFWAENFGEKGLYKERIRGFIDGAISVWDKIKDQVMS